MDNPQSLTDYVFLALVNVANFIGIVYNIPQMWHTYRTKNTASISNLFLNLRILCSVLWLSYSVYYTQWSLFVSWISTFLASLFLWYYAYLGPNGRYKELWSHQRLKDTNTELSVVA